MKVLVNGIGNIGSTLLALLVKYQLDFGISQIYANKNSIQPWHEPELNYLRSLGVCISSSQKNKSDFLLQDILPEMHFIFDCGANGSGLKNKNNYMQLPNLKGVVAQGSEKGFGVSFMSGIGNDLLLNEKYIHVVSCNTHGTAAILKTFCGGELTNLKQGDFVVVRRSEDIGNHERLVSANVVARHLNSRIGTHHAIDVVDMFSQQKILCPITSSDITTPSQLLHAVRFHIEFKQPISADYLTKCICENPYLATTKKFDSNVIFEQGRRYGFNGRIFSHAILVAENMLLTENSVKGWAFVPQEGNTILSSLHAMLIKLLPEKSDAILHKLQQELLKKTW
ncbi:MAG: hypothetical protein IPH66_17855 [Crocinitomicaceae bacterium]|nr:hypothetical protein [Crocinitomicaceae bacterium]